jgi:DNA polymerase V
MKTTKAHVPYYPACVQAGFPSPAMDYMEERIDMNTILVKHPLSTFIVECTGDSMINAFIPPKARLIVDRAIIPKTGDIVLAVLNGEFTVKFLKKNDHNCFLVPANSKYPVIKITPEMDMQVWGVVTNIITDANDVRKCML